MAGATGRRDGQSEELIAENMLPSVPKNIVFNNCTTTQGFKRSDLQNQLGLINVD